MTNVGLVREIKKKETMKYAAQNAAKKHKKEDEVFAERSNSQS